MEQQIVPAGLAPELRGSIRGHVDRLDGTDGVLGWAIDLDDPATPLTLELRVGGTIVATTACRLPRPEIAARVPGAAPAGFRFGPEAAVVLRRLSPRFGTAEVVVHVAGTAARLLGPPGRARLDQIAPPPATVGTGPARALSRLAALRAAARPLPIGPQEGEVAGLIEAVAFDDADILWLIGWLRTPERAEAAITVDDGRPRAAALMIATFPREDLPPGHVGYLGAALTDWRPAAGSRAALLFGSTPIRTATGLRVIAKRQFAEQLARLTPLCDPAALAPLLELLDGAQSWTPGHPPPERLQDAGPHAALDQLLWLPGFGLIASGWLLAPLRRLSRLMLRWGTAALDAEPGSLRRSARPDVATSFPALADLTADAGVVCIFPATALPPLTTAILRAVYDDGGFSQHPVEARAIRRLGHDVAASRALRAYPGLVDEPFFPAFAAALRAAARDGRPTPRPPAGAAMSHAVVVVLPSQSADRALMWSELARVMPGWPDGAGLIVLATPDVGDGAARIAALGTSGLAWLVTVADAARALHDVAALLGACGAATFAFIAAEVLPTDAGWARAARAPETDGPLLLGVDDPAEPTPLAASPTAEFFVWRTIAFALWTPPALIGGYRADNGLPRAGRRGPLPGCAHRLRLRLPDRLTDALDAGAVD